MSAPGSTHNQRFVPRYSLLSRRAAFQDESESRSHVSCASVRSVEHACVRLWAGRENSPLAFRKSDAAMGATIRGRSCGSGTGWVHVSWNGFRFFARAETTSRAVLRLVFGFGLRCLLLYHCHASMLTSFSTFLFDFLMGGGVRKFIGLRVVPSLDTHAQKRR